ncbi:FadR/GntR family transcriptional regulator [Parafrigoribacterium soli]|uniref:FadR/GntR family transcriptional regulator n=1 Tax=Parafrigoribacterium soli TaxID=3144663 RepID=UPI0032EC6651
MAQDSTASPGDDKAEAATHPQSQTDVVISRIRDMLSAGELAPGARLPIEKELASSFGVSRGSLREAVRALCIMGVLETRQGDGTYVTSLDSRLLLAPMEFMVELQSPEHRHDIHAVRRLLEAEAAARAALNITQDELDEARRILDGVDALTNAEPVTEHEAIMDADIAFHRVVAHAANNSTLAALIDALGNRTSRARLWLGLHHQGQTRTAHNEHVAILRALESHQPDRARLEMDHHLLGVEDILQEQPGIDEP